MSLIWQEDVEERQALMEYGMHQRSRSKTGGLCTLKLLDDAAWHFLEVRTRASAVWGEVNATLLEKKMVILAARKWVDGVESKQLSAAEHIKSMQDDAGDIDEDENKQGEERYEYKSFAELLDSQTLNNMLYISVVCLVTWPPGTSFSSVSR